jgi:hypothetical protein
MIHVRLRLGQNHGSLAYAAITDDRLVLNAAQGNTISRSEPVDKHEAHVVAVAAMFSAWVAEANQQDSALRIIHVTVVYLLLIPTVAMTPQPIRDRP